MFKVMSLEEIIIIIIKLKVNVKVQLKASFIVKESFVMSNLMARPFMAAFKLLMAFLNLLKAIIHLS
jgi:hypothetical protein